MLAVYKLNLNPIRHTGLSINGTPNHPQLSSVAVHKETNHLQGTNPHIASRFPSPKCSKKNNHLQGYTMALDKRTYTIAGNDPCYNPNFPNSWGNSPATSGNSAEEGTDTALALADLLPAGPTSTGSPM